jgi:hypothetical protein
MFETRRAAESRRNITEVIGVRRSGRWPSRPIIVITAITIVALLLRVAFVLTVMRHHALSPDAVYYREVARNLAEAHAYALQNFSGRQAVAQFPPLWPLALAPISWVAHSSHTAEQLWEAVLGAANVALIGWIGLRIGGPAVGCVAAALAAVDPMLIAADASMLSETLFVLLTILACIAVYGAVTRPTTARWAVVGGVLGLATLTRSDGALFAFIIVAIGVTAAAISWSRRFLYAATALLVFAIVLAPWMIRNERTFGHWVPLSDNGGTVLAGANCPSTYAGTEIGSWSFFCLAAVQKTIPRGLGEVHAAAVYRHRGLQYARAHLGRLPRVVAARIARTAGLFRPFAEMRIEAQETRVYGVLVAGWVFDVVLVVLACAGLPRLARNRRARWIAIAIIVFVVLDSAFAYGNQRFRLVAEPLLVIAAATGCVALAQRSPLLRGRTPSRS